MTSNKASNNQSTLIPEQDKPLQLIGFAPKPLKKCDLGRPVKLLANHFYFKLKKPLEVYHYDLSIWRGTREILSRNVSKRVFLKLIEKYSDYKNKLFFDFMKNLYSFTRFDDDEFVILIDENDPKNKLEVRLKFTKSIQIDDTRMIEESQVQILQILFIHNLNLLRTSINRSFFDINNVNGSKPLGPFLNLWKGIFISMRPSELGLNLNINVANSVFTRQGSIIDLVCEFFTGFLRSKSPVTPNHLQEILTNNRNKNELESNIKGFTVKNRLKHNKIIHGLGPSANRYIIPDLNIKINEYYRQIKINLKYPDLPCLDLGKKNFTPMELCTLEIKNHRKLTNWQKSEMIKQTAIRPLDRKNEILKLVEDIEFHKYPELTDINIDPNPRMIDFTGRILNDPTLEFGQNQLIDEKDIGKNGQWNIRGKKFLDPKSISNWTILNYSRYANIKTLISTLKNVAKFHGMNFRNDPFEIDYSNNNSAKEPLENKIDRNTELIIIILQNNQNWKYNELKKLFDINLGIPTQAVCESTLEKVTPTLCSNLLLKINLKLGGRNYRIQKSNQLFSKHLKKYFEKPVMIFGIDVNHPAPTQVDNEDKNNKSIAAVVGSLDVDFCYYAARLLAQSQQEVKVNNEIKERPLETVYALRYPVGELLRAYFKSNKRFPSRLVFFRDGISEGQFDKVLNHEMNEIRAAWAELKQNYNPPVTFIVVQKRHQTRFFPMNNQDVTKTGNILPGTLVDSKVVTPDLFDFYLASHMGIKGTTKPCHYYVLHDENNFEIEEVVLLSHYLCHIYGRSTTAVSYPAPTYYSDLCAERGRQYGLANNLNGPRFNNNFSSPINVNEKLKDTMFYI